MTRPIRRRTHWVLLHGLIRFGIERAARRGDPQARFMLATRPGGDVEASVQELRRTAGPGGLVAGRLGHATVDHALCREVLTSPDFTSGIVLGESQRLERWINSTHGGHLDPLRPPSLLMIEAPDHTRVRKLTTRWFTGRAVARLQEQTTQIATDLLDGLEAHARAGQQTSEVIASYCAQLPVQVISRILGVPDSESARVLELGTQVASSLDLGASYADAQSVIEGLEAFDDWLEAHLEWLRRNPGDNLLSYLVQAHHEDQLSSRELAGAAGLILAAGFETTVNLLGNGIRLLIEHPDQLAVLRNDPQGWDNACEEVLRFDPPVLLSGRHSVTTTVLGGVTLPRNSMVTAVIHGANRDPLVFERPDVFDVKRANASQHLSFSAGRHHCLGAALARMEGTTGLRLFFERFPHAAVEPGARRRSTRILRGWEELPLRLVD